MQTTNVTVRDIPLDHLHANEQFNCRGRIAPIDVIDLSKSMEDQGLQSPIIVRPYTEAERNLHGKHYLIIAGYRRFNAARILKWETIPCIINSEIQDVEAIVMNLTENIHRANLTIQQEAMTVGHLRDRGLTQEAICEKLGQSRPWVHIRLMLLDLPEDIQEEAGKGNITQKQIKDIFYLPTREDQYAAVKQIKEARSKGERGIEVKKKQKRSIYTKKQRSRAEIFEMMDHIQEYVGNNFGTRCLAWVAGEIPDYELYRDLKQMVEADGRHYTLPKESMSEMPKGIIYD